jgi:DNA-binding Xre family transcriptional regulator
MINVIQQFAIAKGCRNAYEFWKITGIPQATAYRLYTDPNSYPSRDTQNAICKAFEAQPGDFLRYVPDEDEDE